MTRPPIPRNTKIKLWAESLGYCANPSCRTELFKGDKDFAEMAHIVPYAQTQDHSFDNLVAVCPSCHTSADKSGKQEKVLREWKSNQREIIQREMETKYKSFEAMSEVVRPILERNKFMCENYYEYADSSGHWKLFEPAILANNEKLLRIFEANMNLFQGTKDFEGSNRWAALRLIGHIREFKETRGEEIPRIVLFPEVINSMFGVSPIKKRYVQNVSALQNFVKLLKQENRFINLDFTATPPTLNYLENNNRVALRLDDGPKVQQIYWDTRSYIPRKTELRLESLIFFLSWLGNNGLSFSFPDNTDLTRVKINGKNGVAHFKLVYEYCLSAADVHKLSPERGLHIVNLHNWNGDGCISSEARELENVYMIKIFSLNQFYIHAHEHLTKP